MQREKRKKKKDSKPRPNEKLHENKPQEKKDYSPSTLATANASSVSLTSHVESTVITNSKIVPFSRPIVITRRKKRRSTLC